MEAAGFCGVLVNIHHSTWHHIPEHCNLQLSPQEPQIPLQQYFFILLIHVFKQHTYLKVTQKWNFSFSFPVVYLYDRKIAEVEYQTT